MVTVRKTLLGATDVQIDVAALRAHGDTRLPGAVAAGLPPLWEQILGPVLPSCAEAARARGDTPGTFALHPAPSLDALEEEDGSFSSAAGGAGGGASAADLGTAQNPVTITVHKPGTDTEEVVIVAGQQGICLLPVPSLALATFGGRAITHMMALVLERDRAGVSVPIAAPAPPRLTPPSPHPHPTLTSPSP